MREDDTPASDRVCKLVFIVDDGTHLRNKLVCHTIMGVEANTRQRVQNQLWRSISADESVRLISECLMKER